MDGQRGTFTVMSVVEQPAMGGLVCAKCGLEHKRCSAHTRSGAPCGIYPAKGLRVCRRHGGGTQAAKAKAKRVQAWQAMQGEFTKLGIAAPVDDPAEPLMAMVREAAGNVAFLRWRVGRLNQEVGGEGQLITDLESWLEMTEPERAAVLTDIGQGIAQRVDPENWRTEMNVLVRQYDLERDRLVKYSKIACDAGIQERLVKVVEQDANEIVRVIRHVLDGLDLTPVQVEQGRTLLREALETQSCEAAQASPRAIATQGQEATAP